jgi:hypothetical protein
MIVVPVPEQRVAVADALLPGGDWRRARLGSGGSHDVGWRGPPGSRRRCPDPRWA